MRAFLRLLSSVFASALVVFGVLGVIEVVRATTGSSPAVLRWRAVPDNLARNTWADAGPRVAAILATLVGLVLVVLAVKRGRPAAFGLTAHDDRTEVLATRRGLGDHLRRTVEDLDGVRSARVRIGRRRVAVMAMSAAADTSPVEEAVRSSVEARLSELELASPLTLKVSARAAS